MIPLEEHQYEPVTDRKLHTKPLQPEGKLLDRRPSILKRESSTSQVMLKNIANSKSK